MALKALFATVKETGLIKKLDQYLLLSYEDDPDRRHDINSPSGALKCMRANYYGRTGVKKEQPSPRLRRIFDNGHGVHKRLQKYMLRAGILLMDEIPLFDLDLQIQGHTDGVAPVSSIEIAVVEIKSINTHDFAELRKPHDDHKAQAQVYRHCLEKRRKELQAKYKTFSALEKDKKNLEKFYRSLYTHITDDPWKGGKTREEKIEKKVKEHYQIDCILYNTKKPITKVIVLYENKNDQEMKEYVIEKDDELLEEALDKFQRCNVAIKKRKVPQRECKSKPRFCGYNSECWG